MKDSKNLKLKVLDIDVDNEKTREVITEYSKNFEKIDSLYDNGNDLASLIVGQNYTVGAKLWNSAPAVGSPVGWVNIREGIYANPRREDKHYVENDIVSSNPSTEYYYECVSSGRTPNRPTVFLGANVPFYDVKNVSMWRPSTNYVLNEIVFATNGSETFYYIVEVAGLSSPVEPDWSSVGEGISLVDNTVTWRKEKNPKWIRKTRSANFRPFGTVG